MLTDEAKLFLAVICLAAIIVPWLLVSLDHSWQVNQVLKPLEDHFRDVAERCPGPDAPGNCIDGILTCRNRILRAAGAALLGKWWIVWNGYYWIHVRCDPAVCLHPFGHVDVAALTAIRDEFLESHRCPLTPAPAPAPPSGPPAVPVRSRPGRTKVAHHAGSVSFPDSVSIPAGSEDPGAVDVGQAAACDPAREAVTSSSATMAGSPAAVVD